MKISIQNYHCREHNIFSCIKWIYYSINKSIWESAGWEGRSILNWVVENIQNCFSMGICLIFKLSLKKYSRVNFCIIDIFVIIFPSYVPPHLSHSLFLLVWWRRKNHQYLFSTAAIASTDLIEYGLKRYPSAL